MGFGFSAHYLIPSAFEYTFWAIGLLLISGLVLAGLLYTMLLQSRDLKMRRDDLPLTRDKVTLSVAAQKEYSTYTSLAAKISASISNQ